MRAVPSAPPGLGNVVAGQVQVAVGHAAIVWQMRCFAACGKLAAGAAPKSVGKFRLGGSGRRQGLPAEQQAPLLHQRAQ